MVDIDTHTLYARYFSIPLHLIDLKPIIQVICEGDGLLYISFYFSIKMISVSDSLHRISEFQSHYISLCNHRLQTDPAHRNHCDTLMS